MPNLDILQFSSIEPLAWRYCCRPLLFLTHDISRYMVEGPEPTNHSAFWVALLLLIYQLSLAHEALYLS